MSYRLTPQMAAALRTGRYPLAPLIEIDMPDWSLRHLVGSSEVAWKGQVYRGKDARFGVLVAAGNLRDGVLDEAPDWPLTFAPPDEIAVDLLTRANIQGSRVAGYLGLIDRNTGQLLPEPIQMFEGDIDVPRLRVGKGSRTVEFRCVSALECFHDGEIGARLSDAWHQMVWPGETGLANMSGIDKTSYWGVEKAPSGVTYGTGGGGGTGLYNRAVQQ